MQFFFNIPFCGVHITIGEDPKDRTQLYFLVAMSPYNLYAFLQDILVPLSIFLLGF